MASEVRKLWRDDVRQCRATARAVRRLKRGGLANLFKSVLRMVCGAVSALRLRSGRADKDFSSDSIEIRNAELRQAAVLSLVSSRHKLASSPPISLETHARRLIRGE